MTDQLEFEFGPDAEPPEAASTHQMASPVATRATKPAPQQARRQGEQTPRILALSPEPVERRPRTLRGCVESVRRALGNGDAEVKAVVGAVRTLLRVILKTKALSGQEDLPADPVELRPHLRGAMPAAIGLSRSRFDNARSIVTTLLIGVGWVSPHVRSREALCDFWADRLGQTSREQPAGALIPFFRYCGREGIAPNDISVETVEAYASWLTTETLDPRPRHTANSVATAWRRMQRLRPNWPPQIIRLGSDDRRKALPMAAFPAAFVSDLERYLEVLRKPDPLDPDQGRPLSPVSIRSTRYALFRAATFLVGSGVPIDKVRNLATLVTPEAFRAIALTMHRDGLPRLRAANETVEWTRSAYDIAGILIVAARRWVKPAPEVLAEISAMRKRITPRLDGLSERVQGRLAAFITDEQRAALYGLPWRAFAAADEMLQHGDPRRAAKLHESALALAIVLLYPMRREDLAALDLGVHFIRDSQGCATQIAVRAKKTGAVYRARLLPQVANRIAWHFKEFRPHLPGKSLGSALFPGRDSATRTPSALGNTIKALVAKQLGVEFTPHLARHLSVDIVLDDDPANLAVAQRLLTHRHRDTTAKIYGPRATLGSSQHFAEVLREQAARAGMPPPEEISPRRQKRST